MTDPEIDTSLDPMDQALRALPLIAGYPIYQRNGYLVDIIREAQVTDGRVTPNGPPTIRKLPRPILKRILRHAITWTRGDDIIKDAPAEVVSLIESMGEWENIRPLHGIASWPILSPSGKIITKDGFDLESGLLISGVPDMPPIGTTKEEAQKSLKLLIGLLVDFPFSDPSGPLIWVASLLATIARPAIAGPTPATIFDAPTPGSGKTLLAQAIFALLTGKPPVVRMAPQDASEWQRSLLAIAQGGHPAVILDNLKGKVDSGPLEAAITSCQVSDRLVRSSSEVTIKLNAVFLLTANNLELSPDLARRSLYCRLTPEEQSPENRTGYTHPFLLDHILGNRPQLLAASLTILKAWQLEKSKKKKKNEGLPQLTAMGSFESWSEVVRQPLHWLAPTIDITTTRRQLLLDLSYSDSWGDLLEIWYDHFPGKKVTFTQALTKKEISECLKELAGNQPKRRLQQELKRQLADKVLGGYQLRNAGRGKHGMLWEVIKK